jgi:hypothetical protein
MNMGRELMKRRTDDVFWRDLEVDGEAHVGRDGVVKLTWEPSFGSKAVVDGCSM